MIEFYRRIGMIALLLAVVGGATWCAEADSDHAPHSACTSKQGESSCAVQFAAMSGAVLGNAIACHLDHASIETANLASRSRIKRLSLSAADETAALAAYANGGAVMIGMDLKAGVQPGSQECNGASDLLDKVASAALAP